MRSKLKPQSRRLAAAPAWPPTFCVCSLPALHPHSYTSPAAARPSPPTVPGVPVPGWPSPCPRPGSPGPRVSRRSASWVKAPCFFLFPVSPPTPASLTAHSTGLGTWAALNQRESSPQSKPAFHPAVRLRGGGDEYKQSSAHADT